MWNEKERERERLAVCQQLVEFTSSMFAFSPVSWVLKCLEEADRRKRGRGRDVLMHLASLNSLSSWGRRRKRKEGEEWNFFQFVAITCWMELSFTLCCLSISGLPLNCRKFKSHWQRRSLSAAATRDLCQTHKEENQADLSLKLE